MNSKKEENLINSVEDFYATTTRVVDEVYNLIDDKCQKIDLIPVIANCKEYLSKLEKTLKDV